MSFPISLPGISFNLAIGNGKEKNPTLTAAPATPVAGSSSGLTLDGKEAAIVFMGFALIFLTITVMILALRPTSSGQ